MVDGDVSALASALRRRSQGLITAESCAPHPARTRGHRHPVDLSGHSSGPKHFWELLPRLKARKRRDSSLSHSATFLCGCTEEERREGRGPGESSRVAEALSPQTDLRTRVLGSSPRFMAGGARPSALSQENIAF